MSFTTSRIAFAFFISTAIEFYDFYITRVKAALLAHEPRHQELM